MKFSKLLKKTAMSKNGTEYRTLNPNIRNKCRQAKVEWLNEKHVEIERMRIIDMAGRHTKIKEITGKETCYLIRCIILKEGTLTIK